MNSERLKEIEELAIQKEKEWKHITTLQIMTLQATLSTKEKECKEFTAKFLKLKEDFKYNLKLLQERDQELKKYDESFLKVKVLESSHIAEISDLRIKMSTIEESLQREKQAGMEMQRHYRQRVLDQQTEMETFRTAKDAEIEETLDQLSQVKSRFERVEAQLNAELESQRIELTSEFDDALRKKDREMKEREDQIRADALAHQLKAKLLEKELELVKSAQEKQAESLKDAGDAGNKLKKKLQQTEWDLKDVSTIKNARILELEAQVQQLISREKEKDEDYECKYRETDKKIRIREGKIEAARLSHLEKEKMLNDEIRTLQAKAEAAEYETKRTLWDKNDMTKEHQVAVSKLKEEINDLKTRLENQIQSQTSSTVSKDVEIQSLKHKEDIMRNEIEKLQDDVEKYKRELAASTKRENTLLQSKAQLKLDWQQRCEDTRQKEYKKSETLIENLTKSRDVARAQVRKLQRELGIEISEAELDSYYPQAEQIKELKEQNNNFKSIIEQMTTDMQRLAEDKKNAKDSIQTSERLHDVVTPVYVHALETEIAQLKKEKREREEKVDIMSSNPPGTPVIVDHSFTHPDVKAHINALNETIGNLRSQQINSSAQLQKLQVRVKHQEDILNARELDVKRHLGRIQELEYELSSKTRRADQEMESLKKRISDLDLQLAESRKEADAYYRGGIQNNLHATQLGNQISQMTVNKASGDAPWMADVARDAMVQQFQFEITNLRKELSRTKQALILTKCEGKPSKASALNKQLHEKLKFAAEQISHLLLEKSTLLEAGNSLRAELAAYRKRNPENITGEGDSEIPDNQTVAKKLDESADTKEVNKLKKMEELQYQLTKQELQYAQRSSPQKARMIAKGKILNSTPREEPQLSSNTVETRVPPTSSSIPPLQYSLSSVGDSSIKEVWDMLEQEPSSPSVPGSVETSVVMSRNAPNERESVKISVAGMKPQFQKSKVRTNMGSQRLKPKSRVSKIRNYNLKDDNDAARHFDQRRL